MQSADRMSYFHWLATELCILHCTVKGVREDIKVDNKSHYDKVHKVAVPKWKTGDHMLPKDDTVKPGATQVITKQRFIGP